LAVSPFRSSRSLAPLDDHPIAFVVLGVGLILAAVSFVPYVRARCQGRLKMDPVAPVEN
jgi:hypothetical protein